MKVISFKNFKDVPVCVRVVYGVAVVLALAGMTTLLLDMFEICEIKLCVSMALCTGSLMINNIVLSKYRDNLFKEIGNIK